jgi:hypothetical protein
MNITATTPEGYGFVPREPKEIEDPPEEDIWG